ncbi:MAG: hypothetical protein PHD97_13105 [Bacteroidales bacterium]|nr:hypothetical protein [Bacteroidales bacterium]
MKTKYKYILIVISCILTAFNQILYHYVPANDSLSYLHLAKQYSEFIFFDPVTNCSGHPVYAVFLAITGIIISYNQFVIGFIQTLIFCISALLLIGELEKYLNKNLSALVIILFLVPEIHLFNGYILTESITFSLLLLIFCISLKIHNNGATIYKMLLLSFLMGVAVLNRPECAASIVPVLYLIYPEIKNKLILSILLIVSISVIFLVLNGYKNYKTFNVFEVTAFNGGEVIYGGNNENLDGSHHPFAQYKEIFIPKNKIDDFNKIVSQPSCKSCPQQNSFYLDLAAESWRKNAFKQIGVIPAKFAKNWLLPGNFDVYTSDTTKAKGLQLKKILSKKYFNNRWYAPLKHILYMTVHYILLLIIIIGLFDIDRKNRFQIAVLILLIFYVLFAVPFCGLPRWHVQIFPLLLIAFMPYKLISWVEKNTSRFFKINK